MASRRGQIHAFYNQPRSTQFSQRLGALLEKAAAARDARFDYHGDWVAPAVVVRTDLNGYSAWAQSKDLARRMELLDEFFSIIVPLAEKSGGVYFRDEGDCIVTLFSAYFGGNGFSYAAAERFAMEATRRSYGTSQLTAKTVLACGDVAIFQKAHERQSDDWSAEGVPFVNSVRLEEAIESKRHVVFLSSDYDSYFTQTNVSSGPSLWVIERKNLQVQGLGKPGGWTEVVTLLPK